MSESKPLIWLFILVILVLLGIIILFAAFTITDNEGTLLLHKHTNIVCNFLYDKSAKGWTFEGNSTSISNFIIECNSRGIGVEERYPTQPYENISFYQFHYKCEVLAEGFEDNLFFVTENKYYHLNFTDYEIYEATRKRFEKRDLENCEVLE